MAHMSKETRSRLDKYLHNVAARNARRAEGRSFKRKRIMVLHAIRQGIIPSPEDAIKLLANLHLDSYVDDSMGVKTVKSDGCPDIIYSNQGVYLGKQFGPRKRRTAGSGDGPLMYEIPTG